ncbi:ChaN family lipoprotein [Ketogulonicigenium vulgare]|uniref:Haem-binding uptake Tiki superfamily ChaN domain-containing protein n=1 Tax=Ketogulonicigenium vulgare (strain WSH-001) TaxID=759362 RepID=F9Y527_KETVW|nr:ChaN family lipoprotein [Ketogulonicigenium vulgare]ADO42460.1 conserved hypothetical protein [Ketogulonicigenium vulgare Y25]AEM40659.1 hypothetical protein KVU_0819 [Ketogulonicigenium vulgare WSH-001]ALJ80832.1 hypothetical protein KVH_06360 [Ketogulonicigenium vulgare]ANW33611.1 hypothetical protein KvSKV_06330 [Ketogulonicigenium vulgare]AOZ54373.1 Pdz/dhr/glgf family protein [Ketogulonicigenium vulgare]
MTAIWTNAAGARLTHAGLIHQMAPAPAVLLGERHDRADHHLWQMHVIAGLAAHRPVVVGFEMFPARLDPVLAEWVRGALSEAEFLERAAWGTSWGFPSDLYMPIFRLCRDLRLPMVGLNVPRALVRAVGAHGWDGVPQAEREGLTPAAPSPMAYRAFIFELTGGAREGRAAKSADDPAFDRFLRAQEVWDRAFATHILRAARAHPGAQVIGVIGMGHLQHGGGVSHQLADLGLPGSRVLLPVAEGDTMPAPGAADAICQLPRQLAATLAQG